MKEVKKHPAFLGEIRINKLSCDGCGVCVSSCPNNVLMLKDLSDAEMAVLSFLAKLMIRFKGRRKSYVNDYQSCIACGLCEKSCHERAIRVGERTK
jgi:NAD-dependent dihydropyrimidine dehydrogenase PreA subunit